MLRALVLILPLLFSSLCFAQTEAETQAVDAAKPWLQLIDNAKYDDSWEQASSVFRQSMAKSEWKKMVPGVRRPFGAPEGRELDSAKYTGTVPGAPDGEYVIVQFKTKFANKAAAVETAVMMKDTDGQWRV